MKRGILIALFASITLFGLFSYVYSTVTSSPLLQFNVTISNDTSITQLVLNYANSYTGNITLMVNTSSGINTLEIVNSSIDSALAQNYTQGDIRDICSPGINSGIKLLTRTYNGTGNYTTFISDLNNKMSLNFTLIAPLSSMSCFPGAYLTTTFTIRNASRTNETTNITVRLDVPISSSNTLNTTTGIGNFTGILPANATTYHSFFFNTTSGADGEVANITGFAINLTTPSDADIFVLNNATILKAKSINKTANTEWLLFSKYDEFTATPSMWEIRVYGNNTTSQITYTGNVIFTTLNITNSSVQKPIDINFKNMNATSNTTINLTLSNTGNITLSNIAESKEIYYVKIFGNSSTSNFSLFIPGSAVITKVKASLNWTVDANYTLNIYYPNNTLASTSTNKFIPSNVSGVMEEEYSEIASIPTSAGMWKFEAVNNTPPLRPFNITIYAYYDASTWIATNFTTMTLSSSNISNIQGNFTVPSTAMSGTHEGFIQYLDSRKAGIRIPLKVNVYTPMLVVNDTLDSITYQINQNYGVNLTMFDTYFNISNQGNYDLGIKYTSSANMNCLSTSPVSCTGYNATFFFNNTTSTISTSSSFLLNVTIIMNNSLPAGTVYTGWIFINGTNQTDSNLTAHPHPDFNITLKLNVTDLLKIIIDDVKSMDGIDNVALNYSNISKSEDVTLRLYIQTINGTNLTLPTSAFNNITAVWLQEENVTDTTARIPTAGNVSFFGGSTPWNTGGYFYVNVTIPGNQPGGRYIPFINISLSNSTPVYYGTSKRYAKENVVVVNNSGFFMSTNTTGCSFGSSCDIPLSVSSSDNTTIVINVSNYGPMGNSSATLALGSSCTGWTVTNTTPFSNCPAAGFSSTFNPAPYSTNCTATYFVIAPINSSSCTVTFRGAPSYNWFNSSGVVIRITSTNSSSATTTTTSSSSASSSSSSTSATVANYLDITSYPSLIIVTQGKTNSTLVRVKNTNSTYTQLIKLTIDGIDSSWFSVSPSTSQSTAALATVNFTVTFSPPADATIKDYTPSFKAISEYANLSKTFTLKVLPTEATKTQINVSLDQFKANVTKLEADLNASKLLGLNVSAAQIKLNQLKAKIDEAQAFINSGDYNSAYALFDTIKSLMNDVRTEIDNAKKTSLFGSDIIKYILIGGGVAAAVVLAYLFWPSKPAPGRAAVTEGAGIVFGKTKEAGSNVGGKLKGVFEKIKSKFSRKKETKLNP